MKNIKQTRAPTMLCLDVVIMIEQPIWKKQITSKNSEHTASGNHSEHNAEKQKRKNDRGIKLINIKKQLHSIKEGGWF